MKLVSLGSSVIWSSGGIDRVVAGGDDGGGEENGASSGVLDHDQDERLGHTWVLLTNESHVSLDDDSVDNFNLDNHSVVAKGTGVANEVMDGANNNTIMIAISWRDMIEIFWIVCSSCKWNVGKRSHFRFCSARELNGDYTWQVKVGKISLLVGLPLILSSSSGAIEWMNGENNDKRNYSNYEIFNYRNKWKG